MAKTSSASTKAHTPVHKRTSQGGKKPKLSSMSKVEKRNHKKYRGQGR